MQVRLRDAIVSHSYANSRDQIDPGLMTPTERAVIPPVRWRMTWRNPANDRVALYIASHAYAVEGMSESEAKALLAELIATATRPEFTFRHQWRPGDVIMWDNRATMHRGHRWTQDQARSMVRTTISAVDADGLTDLRPGDRTGSFVVALAVGGIVMAVGAAIYYFMVGAAIKPMPI
jgi:alpha-ketoglutarate-dependent 2,4-dichlorophenoxyacetate dioxygenase